MHASVLDFGHRFITAEMVTGKKVLEVGSRDINGSLRPHVEALKPEEYVGVDEEDGPGVDTVGDAPNRKFDLVICTEVMEHAEDWRSLVETLKSRTKVGGYLLVTTRSPGFPHHAYPSDHWRFTRSDFEDIFSDLEPVELASDPQKNHPGLLALYRMPKGAKSPDLSKITPRKAPKS